MQVVQSQIVLFLLRPHGSSTWYQLVCLEAYNEPWETQSTQTETQCGVATGLGAIKFNPSGTGVMETDPNSTQVTLEHLRNWQIAQQVLDYQIQNPGSGGSAGSFFYTEGQCYVQKAELIVKEGDVVKFAWALLGNGQPTNIPGTIQ